MQRELKLLVNGRDVAVATDEERPLLDVVREELGLTGPKYGCGEGECGCCTVLVGGEAIRSCITSVGEAEGVSITTIEGLANGDELHPVQQAFLDHQAMQCGYCVPGQIMSAVALLHRTPSPSRADVVATMRDNLCRCCNYEQIAAAVESAAAKSLAPPVQ